MWVGVVIEITHGIAYSWQCMKECQLMRHWLRHDIEHRHTRHGVEGSNSGSAYFGR